MMMNKAQGQTQRGSVIGRTIVVMYSNNNHWVHATLCSKVFGGPPAKRVLLLVIPYETKLCRLALAHPWCAQLWIQFLSFSCSFLRELAKITGWRPRLYGCRCSSGKSWIHHCGVHPCHALPLHGPTVLDFVQFFVIIKSLFLWNNFNNKKVLLRNNNRHTGSGGGRRAWTHKHRQTRAKTLTSRILRGKKSLLPRNVQVKAYLWGLTIRPRTSWRVAFFHTKFPVHHLI